VLLFDNIGEKDLTPDDATSAFGDSTRFHGARAGEAQDSVQSLRARRSLRVGLSTVLSYDYKAKKAVAASVPTAGAVGGPNAPLLESFDTPGQYSTPTTPRRAATRCCRCRPTKRAATCRRPARP
jgi:type VI secretion system secreted protein VgrG